MYTRITYPKVQFFDNDGQFGIGYQVYTLAAGSVDTLQTTYKDRLLTAPNANPIILDARGEANIYTGQAVQLVFTAPGASITSPIVSVDYVGEQQNAVMVSGNAIPGTIDNNYKLVLVPALTSIPPNLTVVMTPDVTNTDTLVTPTGASSPTVFTGTGINDALFSGPYNGDVAGAIFQVEIDGVYIPVPGTAPTLADYVTAGLVTAGNHSIVYTYVTANGESGPSPASNVINSAGSRQLAIHGIAVGPTGTTARNVYMVQAGGTTYYLAYTISDNTTTSLNLNVADASLTQAISTTEPSADTFKWQVDGGGWTTGVAILGNNASQPLINGISITFAEYSGHTLGDMWTVTVMTPATLDIGLGAALIWDNVGGALVLLSGNSMVAGVPATLVWAAGVAGWVLNNPSLPVLSSLPRKIYRRELVGDYTLSINDSGNELSYIGLGGNTLTLCPAITASGDVFDFYNAGPGLWTITAAGSDTIIIPGFPAGVSSIILGGTNPWYGCRLVTNGANWHVLATTVKTSGGSQVMTNAGTWVCPSGVTTAYVTGCGGGGGGGGGLTGGSGGGAGQQAVKIPITVVPGTTYTATVGAAGTGGAGDGVAGGETKLVTGVTTLIDLTGGTAGVGGGTIGGGANSVFGAGGASGAPGANATGFGAGGGGGTAGASGGNGSPGELILEW